MEKLITQSLAACLRDPMDDATLGMTAAAWARILANVPIDQLDACYLDAWALPSHKAGFPVTADEILAAWIARRNRPPALPVVNAEYLKKLRGGRYASNAE